MRVPRSFGLQGWLVAALLAVGMAAALAVLLVVLPTLSSSVRSDRATNEAKRLGEQLAEEVRRHRGELQSIQGQEELAAFADQVRLLVGGQVRVRYRRNAFAPTLEVSSPRESPLLDILRARQWRIERAFSPDRDVAWATVPIPGGVGLLSAAVAVGGVDAELAAVRRRVIIAVFVVLALAALAGYGLARYLGRRIWRLADTAAQLAGGDLDARAPDMTPRELSSLSESINGMADRVQELVGEISGERDKAQALVRSLAEGVLVVSPGGDVVVANAAAQRMLGLAQGPVRLEALPPALMDAAREALGAGGVAASLALGGEGGRELEVELAPLGSGRAGLVLTLRDVTETRRLDRARRELVANVSHELKTPLSALRGFLELLEGAGVDDETRREFLASMSQEAERLERLVEEQLELARMDAGELPLEREPVDVAALALEVAGPRVALAERQGVALEVEAPSDTSAVVDADPGRIEQVLLILLDNALRHTAPGGSVVVQVEREQEELALTVRDDGEGIPAEEQPFVFDRFYRGDRARAGRSAGLGLAIARGIAEAHGGTIALSSELGRGSSFTLRLPQADSPTRDPAAAGHGAERAG